MEMSPIREGLLKSELNLLWSSTRVILQHKKLIFIIIYKGIKVYWAVRVAKGLEIGMVYHIKEISGEEVLLLNMESCSIF